MIVELGREDFDRVLPLYRDMGVCFPLISAVLQRKQPGQVFVNDEYSSGFAVVVTNFGFMLVVGGVEGEALNEAIEQALTDSNRINPKYLLWYDPPVSWQRRLDALGVETARRRNRIRFEFHKSAATWLNESIQPPPGFDLKPLSRELISKTAKFGVQLESRFWASADNFVENGFGVCLLKDGEMVSLCYAAAVTDGLAEVDTVTDAGFRERGLAAVVGRQFIIECLRRKVTPTWDCFDYNVGSVKLAAKLGFTATCRYPFYSFNIPMQL